MVLNTSDTPISVRPVVANDRQQLASLIHFETHVHRHLDWRAPLEWIGFSPGLVVEREGNLLAALIAPPDPPEISWIRLFAVSAHLSIGDAWNLLWTDAQGWLSRTPELVVAAIPLQNWFRDLLIESGYQQVNDVIMLQWETGNPIAELPATACRLRSMIQDDLSAVEELDRLAFGKLWRNSLDSLQLAYRQAAIATVAELEDRLVAYQISTPSPLGGHLARLAVHPQWQARGIGTSLVVDTLSQFQRRGAQRVTVNTQRDNLASIHIYLNAGFKLTEEVYPVYLFQLAGSTDYFPR